MLEERRSSRRFGERPLSAAQLGEFLFRTSRIRRTGSFEGETYAYRPYPCGGASYELEVYAAVRACEDLEPGLYYYDGCGHSLRAVGDYSPAVERLVEHAWNATGRLGVPHVLLILAARFGRVAWKYESIAYSLILKDVGVVMQTMHLAAAAMGLAACAVGCGDSDLFSMAAGTDYYTESSVGEFVLGSAAEPA